MRNVCQGRDVCQYLEQRHSKPGRCIQYRGKKQRFSLGGISEVRTSAYPLLGEVVGVVLQIMNAAKTSANVVQSQQSLVWRCDTLTTSTLCLPGG